ncbi:MAG: hypothetical protein JKY56_05690 [Kofleriaceae bacterium]|nr:hypothetical protein [Kofleriaceae bacterium]
MTTPTDTSEDMDNPFVVFERTIMGTSTPPALRLRDLILHLYRGHGSIDLRALLRDSGDDYRDVTLSMLAYYAKHGEKCPHFVRIAGVIERNSYFF